MDPGDGHRQRRRPRLFLSLWLLLLLLAQLSPLTIMCINISGDSDFEAHAHLSASSHQRNLLPSTIPSEPRRCNLGDSQWARDRVPSSTPFLALCRLRRPFSSAKLQLYFFCFTETATLARSGLDDKNLSIIKARSIVPDDGTRCLCSSFSRDRYGTNLSSTRSITFICESVRIRLNLHDCNGVPASCVCFAPVPGVFHRPFYPIFDRDCHRHSVVLFNGLIAASKHTPTVSYGKNLVNTRPPDVMLTSLSITGVPQSTFAPISHISASCHRRRRTKKMEFDLIWKVGFWWPINLLCNKPPHLQDWQIIGLDLTSVHGLSLESRLFLTSFKIQLGCYWARPLISLVGLSVCKIVGQSPELKDLCKSDPKMYEL